jgi:hypothetical protein
MINPLTLLKIINERHAFIMNHAELLPFIIDNFGEQIEEGTIMKFEVITPDGKSSPLELEIQDSDMPFFKSIADLMEDIS